MIEITRQDCFHAYYNALDLGDPADPDCLIKEITDWLVGCGDPEVESCDPEEVICRLGWLIDDLVKMHKELSEKFEVA